MKNTYYVIEGNDEVAFLDEWHAYEHDLCYNPDYHMNEEISFERFEKSVYEVTYDQLTNKQREYLRSLDDI